MFYYIILFIILFLSYHYDYKGRKREKKVLYYFLLFFFIILAGFRYRIGVDTIRYESYFTFIPSLLDLDKTDFDNSRYGPLCLIFWSLGKFLSSNFWIMQLLQAILVNYVIFRFIKRNASHIFLAVALYYVFLYYGLMCETMREACAVAMLLLGWEYLKKNKILIFSFFCLLAYGFHNSAITLFIIPILKWTKLWNLLTINIRLIFILIVVFIVGTLIQQTFFQYIILFNISDSITDRAIIYADSYLAGQSFNLVGAFTSIIMNVFYPFMAIVCIKKRGTSINPNLEKMVVIGMAFSILAIPISIFYRYDNYFKLFSLLTISEAAYSIVKFPLARGKQLIVKGLSTWCIVLMLFFSLKMYEYYSPIENTNYKHYMKFYPYSSIVFKDINADREATFRYYKAYSSAF